MLELTNKKEINIFGKMLINYYSKNILEIIKSYSNLLNYIN